MRTKKPQGPPVAQKLHNLVKYMSQEGGRVVKLATPLYNVPYGMAMAMKKTFEAQKQMPGTYFTIEPN
jgi:hypothetical protein